MEPLAGAFSACAHRRNRSQLGSLCPEPVETGSWAPELTNRPEVKVALSLCAEGRQENAFGRSQGGGETARCLSCAGCLAQPCDLSTAATNRAVPLLSGALQESLGVSVGPPEGTTPRDTSLWGRGLQGPQLCCGRTLRQAPAGVLTVLLVARR